MGKSHQELRAELPSTQHLIHLNHAGISPIPSSAAEAMKRHAEDVCAWGSQHLESWLDEVTAARRDCARLLGVGTDQVAFTRSTTHGLLMLANALSWRNGDNVVTCNLEFPANIYPWLSLAWRGVEARIVPARVDGTVSLDDLAEAMDAHTRVLALSWVEFPNGFRHDIGALVELCEKKGCLLCLDVIQGAGALPLDLDGARVHMAAGAAHKWLLGPEGVGFLFCRDDVIEQMIPGFVGWMSVEQPLDFLDYDLTRLRKDARRFEEAPPTRIAVAGFGASLRLLLEQGADWISSQIFGLTEHLTEGLLQAGFTVTSPRRGDQWSGIVSCLPPSGDAGAVMEQLSREKVVAAMRDGKLRLSPHCYNTVEELDEVLDILRRSGA